MKLWGSKTEASFDWWSVGHIGTYYFLTKFFLSDVSFDRALLVVLGVGYAWEVLEVALEEYRHTKKFFPEKEAWFNRYIGDIVANVTGLMLAWFY